MEWNGIISSSDYTPIPQPPAAPSVTIVPLPRLPRKHVPEPQRLVPGARDDDTAIGAHGQVEDSVGVAREAHDLRHAGVLPHDNLVLRVAVRADDLVGVLGPGQVADLRAGVDLVDDCSAHGIMEDYSSIGGSAAGCQEAFLVRRPGDGFHCRRVVAEFEGGCWFELVPDHELVVVSSRC